MVARIDWARFVPFQQIQRQAVIAGNIEREMPEPAVMRRPSGTTPLIDRAQAAPVQQRKQLVLEYLRNAVAEVTRIDAARSATMRGSSISAWIR